MALQKVVHILRNTRTVRTVFTHTLPEGKEEVCRVIRCYSEADHLDYKCPKAGVITELVVDSAFRGRGTGKALIDKMEQYFWEIGCEAISADVFAYNEQAHRFYEKAGYHPRMITMIKKS